MKISNSRGYLFKEGIRSIWSHRLMSLASVAVLMACLILMGLAALFSVNLNEGMSKIEDKSVINIYLYDSVTEEQLPDIEKRLLALENVKEATFVSKEEAWEKFSNDALGSSDFFQGYADPGEILPNSYKVVLKDISKYEETLQQLKGFDEIEETRDDKVLAEKLTSLRRIINIFGSALIAVLLIVSLFIISNTIKLTMYSRRLEISIMKSVGATNTFIRLPFVVEGFVIGLFSGVVSFGLIYGIYNLVGKVIAREINFIKPIPFASIALWILAGFLLVGTITGIVGSLISMGKYLKKEGSEINAI